MNEGYVIGRDKDTGLTNREREVGQMLRDGVARNRIALELGISRQRVAEIVRNLKDKGANWQAWPPSKTATQRRAEAAAEDRAAGIGEDPL